MTIMVSVVGRFFNNDCSPSDRVALTPLLLHPVFTGFELEFPHSPLGAKLVSGRREEIQVEEQRSLPSMCDTSSSTQSFYY